MLFSLINSVLRSAFWMHSQILLLKCFPSWDSGKKLMLSTWQLLNDFTAAAAGWWRSGPGPLLPELRPGQSHNNFWHVLFSWDCWVELSRIEWMRRRAQVDRYLMQVFQEHHFKHLLLVLVKEGNNQFLFSNSNV